MSGRLQVRDSTNGLADEVYVRSHYQTTLRRGPPNSSKTSRATKLRSVNPGVSVSWAISEKSRISVTKKGDTDSSHSSHEAKWGPVFAAKYSTKQRPPV